MYICMYTFLVISHKSLFLELPSLTGQLHHWALNKKGSQLYHWFSSQDFQTSR